MIQATTNFEQQQAEASARTVLRWVLAHEPPVVFEEAAAEFGRLLLEKTDGELAARLIMADEFAAARGQDFVGRTELVEMVQRGEIEMAHCYTAALGTVHGPLQAIELPFLFQSYEHAERVFEGPVAQRLMSGLPGVGLRGIGFAYSGGYRVIATRGRALRRLEDFRGLRLRTAGNPAPAALHASLGASAVGAPLVDIRRLVEEDRIDGCELTRVRFRALGLETVFDTMNDTGHSLFTTMTVANEAWFRALPEKHQSAVVEAGVAACRIERRTAIEEEARTKESCPLAQVTLDRDSEAGLRERARAVREQLAPRFGSELVQAILDQADVATA